MNEQIKNKSKILAGLMLLFCQVLPINASPSNIPLSNLLDASGKLQNCRNLSGAVDFSGYVPIIDDCKGLLFLPMPVAPGWNALGSGLNGTVRAIAVSGSDVYVGGDFTNAGGNANADHIARWDGSTWNALATGLNSQVFFITVSGSDVYVGGGFINAGGNANADCIARWDGSNWNALGTGLSDLVYAIAVSGNDVYAGGIFTNAGGNTNADFIASWDGSAWNALGSGLNNPVYFIAESGDDVFIGGQFTNAGGNANADFIAKWSGNAWYTLGAGLNNFVEAIAISESDVYVGGHFTDAGGIVNADRIAFWDGSGWNALGTGLNSPVYAISIYGSEIYAGGAFTNAGGNTLADYIARWDGSAWNALSSGLNNYILATSASGSDVYVGGGFTDAGGNTSSDYIARWEGVSLPVELLSFGAAQHEKSIRLDWHAATQSLNEGWDIEHSIDGVSWARIGWVQGDGNSSISKQYHFIHQYPKSGHNYYRIRQNDFEGNYVYSRMVMVNLENQAVVKIFPTLTTGIIYFEGNPEYIEEVKVFDPFRGFSYDAHRINHIDISDQPPGLYVVQILKAGKWTSTWVVKQ